MQIVTSFGEPTSENEDNTSDEYAQVFQALANSQKVAENVFARVSKKVLKSRIGDSKFRDAKTARGMVPMWVVSSSVVLVMPSADAKLDQWVIALGSLIEGISSQLNLSTKDKNYVLIDPLSTSIQQVGENIFKFTAKQKWALENTNV